MEFYYSFELMYNLNNGYTGAVVLVYIREGFRQQQGLMWVVEQYNIKKEKLTKEGNQAWYKKI